MPTDSRETSIRINGKDHTLNVPPDASLLEVLRDDLGITGPKYGCGEGVCGACTVLLDGEPVHSCVTDVSEVGGKAVVTIEGLASGERLHPIQSAFLDVEALQCGYCVPGMIMAAHGLLSKNPNPTKEQIADHMQGNICRCGCYPQMVMAIELAAKRMRGGK